MSTPLQLWFGSPSGLPVKTPFSTVSGRFGDSEGRGVGQVWPKSETFLGGFCDAAVGVDFEDARDVLVGFLFVGGGIGFLPFLLASESDVADRPSTTSLASDLDCSDDITLVDSVDSSRVDGVVVSLDVDTDDDAPFCSDVTVVICAAADDVILTETSVVFAVDTESKLFSASMSSLELRVDPLEKRVGHFWRKVFKPKIFSNR